MGKTTIHANCLNCDARFKSVFCDLNSENLETLNSHKSCGLYKKGAQIFAEGQRPYGLYCINQGKIKIFQTGNEGKDQIVRLAKEGDIIGYRALLSGTMYTATAEAIDEASVCFVPKEVFFGLINNEMPLSMELMKLLSLDLKRAENKITNLAQKPVRQRMAEALLFIKETYGFEEDGITINVTLSREDIANIVGTATETAIRLISDLKAEEVVSQKGKRIQILDLFKLVELSGIEE